jgi:hypothetical protein
VKLAECWKELVNDGVAGIRLEEPQEHWARPIHLRPLLPRRPIAQMLRFSCSGGLRR